MKFKDLEQMADDYGNAYIKILRDDTGSTIWEGYLVDFPFYIVRRYKITLKEYNFMFNTITMYVSEDED